MRRPTLKGLKRFLRSPKVIVTELVAIAAAGVLGATIPQTSTATTDELMGLYTKGPVVLALVDSLSLDRVFRSPWFLAILLLAAASLSIVVVEQIGRLRRTWSERLEERHFRRVPHRVEFERPCRSSDSGDEPSLSVRTTGRLGLVGSPAFHIGLLLIIVAGALRALFAVEAVVDLVEGETLPAEPTAWARQWPGVLAGPLSLEHEVTLRHVTATRYDSGTLQDLRIRLDLALPDGRQSEEVAVNHEIRAMGARLFLGSEFGPAALLEWQGEAEPSLREAVLLASRGGGEFISTSVFAGRRAHLRAHVDAAGTRPASIDLRVMDDEALLYAGQLRVGESVVLPGGDTVRLHGAPLWVRLYGSRDPALWLAYVGFVLVVLGAALIFSIVEVDTCVRVAPEGAHERVFVALRAQRFTPLFQERFERLVQREGGAL